MTTTIQGASDEPLEELIQLLLQPLPPENEIETNDQFSLEAHQQIQSNVFSSHSTTTGRKTSMDLTDQQILDRLNDHQMCIEEEFNKIQLQYLDSKEAVDKLIHESQEQTANFKPLSEKLNGEFKQFQHEHQSFDQIYHEKALSDVGDQQANITHPPQTRPSLPSSNSLLKSICEDLQWWKELERIKLWFKILSDFHNRTNELLLDQPQIKTNANLLVASTSQFNHLALEICQIIVSYQKISNHLRELQSLTIHFNLLDYIYQIIQNSINSIIHSITKHLSQTLEDCIDWPKPSRSPLDFASSNASHIVNSFKAAVNFQNILTSQPSLISFDEDDGGVKKKEIIQVSTLNQQSILLKAILDPIILRFRFHFDGGRPTNRLDKPEWYFNHILDRLAEHEFFLKTDVQELYKMSGEGSIDVFLEFTKQLIQLVERKLKRNVPLILEMSPILAHTIESAIRFDCTIKQMNYLSVAAAPKSNSHQAAPQWLGTADVVLSNSDWFRTWFEAEKGYVSDMYLEIISSSDTWDINEEDSRPIEMKIPGTNSSIRIQELIEQTKEKYCKLPKLTYQVEFLIHLQIRVLENYAQRINGILDGFDRNVTRFISVVGAPDSGRSKNYIGFTGLERLVKIYISSNWMLKTFQSWNDDLFYVELYDDLKREKKSLGPMSAEVDKLVDSIESIGGFDVTIFSSLVKQFEELSIRAEAWIVRQVVQEISTELKPYLLKKWDIDQVENQVNAEKEIQEPMELSDEIVRPISTWKSRLKYLAHTIKPLNKLNRLVKTISKEIESKLISKIILDPFTIRAISLLGARQFQFDILYGWLNFELYLEDNNPIQPKSHHPKAIQLEKHFNKLLDCCKLLSYPSSSSISIDGGKTIEFNDLVQLCFKQELDDSQEIRFKTSLKDLAHVSSLSKPECQAILKRRPECWKS